MEATPYMPRRTNAAITAGQIQSVEAAEFETCGGRSDHQQLRQQIR